MQNIKKAEIYNKISDNFNNLVKNKGIEYFYTPEKMEDILLKFGEDEESKQYIRKNYINIIHTEEKNYNLLKDNKERENRLNALVNNINKQQNKTHQKENQQEYKQSESTKKIKKTEEYSEEKIKNFVENFNKKESVLLKAADKTKLILKLNNSVEEFILKYATAKIAEQEIKNINKKYEIIENITNKELETNFLLDNFERVFKKKLSLFKQDAEYVQEQISNSPEMQEKIKEQEEKEQMQENNKEALLFVFSSIFKIIKFVSFSIIFIFAVLLSVATNKK